jgi:hypothetical protein
MSLTNFAEEAWIKHITREAVFTPASTVYIALCSSNPGETATGASCGEVANTGSYARKAISFNAAASRAISNSGTITFDPLTGSLGTSTHYCILDSATYGEGNALAYGQLSVPKELVSGNTPTIGAGQVAITANAGVFTNYAAHGMLNRMFRNQAFTISANYLGLATVNWSDPGTTINEVANTNAYARVQIGEAGSGLANRWGAYGASVAGASVNATQWSFPEATGSWGTVVSAFIADSQTHGAANVLLFDNGIEDQGVNNGDTVYWPIGQFSLSVN